MRRTDTGVAVAAGVALAALIAVSWRATPDRADVALLLYVIGGTLELAGVATIAADLLNRRRRLRRWESEARIVFTGGVWTRLPRGPISPVANLEARMAAVERELRAAVETVREEANRHTGLVVRLTGAAERDTLAWVGFAGLLLGLLVGTAANIVSASG